MERRSKLFIKLVVFCLLAVCVGCGAGVSKKLFAQDYIYYGTLSINWKGWSAYACGENYELTGNSSGKLYHGSPLAVIDTKITKGNEVAYCYSYVLDKNVYVSTKYIEKTEEMTVVETERTEVKVEFQYNFNESEAYKNLKNQIRELYASSTYKDVHSLKNNAVNNNIKGVYNSITSLNDTIFLEKIVDIEKYVYVAAYNGDAGLGELETLVNNLDYYLSVIVEGIDTYRTNLNNMSYWTKKFNPKIALVVADCDRLIAAVNAVVLCQDLVQIKMSGSAC